MIRIKTMALGIAALAGVGLALACGGDDEKPKGKTPPLEVVIEGPAKADAGSRIELDGTQSTGAGALAFSWSLEAPAGSEATLDTPKTELSSFVPDVQGDFVVTLEVRDSKGRIGTATSTIVVRSFPVASAGGDQLVFLGEEVVLDGSGSKEPAGLPLHFNWLLVERPAGSKAALSGADEAIARFTPDRAGSYVVELVVDNGGQTSAPVTVEVEVTPDEPGWG